MMVFPIKGSLVIFCGHVFRCEGEVGAFYTGIIPSVAVCGPYCE